MSGQRNTSPDIVSNDICSKCISDRFVVYGVSIESPIESPVVSSTPLTHQVVEYRINLTEGTFTLLKTNYISRSP
jgi:hypothetical protein